MNMNKKKMLSCCLGLWMLAGSHFAGALAAGTAEAEALPGYYDLRLSVPTDRKSPELPEKALLNPIRNQGLYGTCWSFASVAAVESNMFLQLQRAGIPYRSDQNDVNLSEWYLAWVSRAAPIDVTDDPVSHIAEPMPALSFRTPFAQRVYQGGFPMEFMEFMAANQASFAAETDDADSHILQRMVAPRQYAPQAVNLRQLYGDFSHQILCETDGTRIKQEILRNGAAAFGLCANALQGPGVAFFNARPAESNHAVNIVGWDDAYDFSQTDMPVKPKKPGAWIIRNSWGPVWGEKGYGYISYEDPTLCKLTSVEAELDIGAFSTIDRHENGMDDFEYGYDMIEGLPPSWFASGEKAAADAFLRRVGFYAFSDGLAYTIEVRTGADTPEQGRLVYSQQGVFGQDGTPAWSGYRTVELDKFVFLPKGELYTVSVRLENPQGQVTLVANPTAEAPLPCWVTSYIRLGDTGTWYKDFSRTAPIPPELQHGSVIQREYLKNAAEPLGREFTVASLADGSAAGRPVIDLGRAGELYGKDRLHPDRRTLSVMTVDLAAEETFSGSIRGEGGVVKTGPGRLTLTGHHSYTGETRVQEGSLCLAPRANGGTAVLAGPVVVESGGTFGGSGLVQGDITGSGMLLLPASGTLLAGGRVADGLQVRAAEPAALQSGQVLLQAAGGLPAAWDGLAAGTHHLRVSADGTELLVE